MIARLLRAIFGGNKPSAAPAPRSSPSRVQVGPGSGFWFDIVGEASYQGTLWRVAGQRTLNGEDVFVPCLVVPEPDNAHDKLALCVHVDGYGKVGYFQRDEAAGRYLALGDTLRAQGAVGFCEGKLIGGWQEDKHLGVRLSIRPPSAFGGTDDGDGFTITIPGTAPTPPQLVCPVADWQSHARLSLPPGSKYSVALIEEWKCQPALTAIVGERDVSTETVAFDATIVPHADRVVVCAPDGAPIGRLGQGDVTRYSATLEALAKRQATGTCSGWIIKEGDILGVKLSLKGPAGLAKAIGVVEPSPPPSE